MQFFKLGLKIVTPAAALLPRQNTCTSCNLPQPTVPPQASSLYIHPPDNTTRKLPGKIQVVHQLSQKKNIFMPQPLDRPELHYSDLPVQSPASHNPNMDSLRFQI